MNYSQLVQRFLCFYPRFFSWSSSELTIGNLPGARTYHDLVASSEIYVKIHT